MYNGSKCSQHVCVHMLLYISIDRTLMNSVNGMLNCEIGGLDRRVITTEYGIRVHCIHM